MTRNCARFVRKIDLVFLCTLYSRCARHATSGFCALVSLDTPYLERDGRKFALNAGMLVSAEVNLGSRTVMKYLLSPVRKTGLEAGRER